MKRNIRCSRVYTCTCRVKRNQPKTSLTRQYFPRKNSATFWAQKDWTLPLTKYSLTIIKIKGVTSNLWSSKPHHEHGHIIYANAHLSWNTAHVSTQTAVATPTFNKTGHNNNGNWNVTMYMDYMLLCKRKKSMDMKHIISSSQFFFPFFKLQVRQRMKFFRIVS